ncbi:hypothetical protein ACFL9T_01750 [Thermodesulfobacteriota bacterium]
MIKRLSLTLLLLFLPHSLNAEYTDSCGLYAQMLWSAADNYDSAKSSFDSAKDSYESACDPYYGYSKNDESACGSYGYERSSYDDARSELENAKSELEDALNNVALFCGPCDDILGSFMSESKKNINKLKSEIDQLKKKLIELESANKTLNKKIKPTQ